MTNKDDNYEDNIKILNEILFKYNITLKSLNFWNDLTEYHDEDFKCHNKYIETFNIKQYGDNNNIWGYAPRKKFNPGNLWWRRYVNFNLYDKNKKNNESYDLFCLTRLFSSKIINIKKKENFNFNCLYFSPDTFFCGNYENIKKLLNFGMNCSFYNVNNQNNKPILLDDINFLNYAYSFDSNIFNHVFCSEIQILYYIYKNFDNYENIRFDFTKYIKDEKVKENIHSLIYKNNYNIDQLVEKIFENSKNSYLFVTINR